MQIQIRIRVKSFIRIRIKVKIQKLERPKIELWSLIIEAWRLKMEPWTVYTVNQLSPIPITLMGTRIRIKGKAGSGSA
jgi:hypothetical protein